MLYLSVCVKLKKVLAPTETENHKHPTTFPKDYTLEVKLTEYMC